MGRPHHVATPLTVPTRVADSRGVARRGADVLCAAVLLVVAAPFMLVAAIAVRMGSHGPVLHREPVLDERGRVLELLSFRVMVDGGDTHAHSTVRAVLGTAAQASFAGPGRVLRATRADRLPRLLNVAAGRLPLF